LDIKKCIDKLIEFRASDKAPILSIGFNSNFSIYNRNSKENPNWSANTDVKECEIGLIDLALVSAAVIAFSAIITLTANIIFNIRYRKRF